MQGKLASSGAWLAAISLVATLGCKRATGEAAPSCPQLEARAEEPALPQRDLAAEVDALAKRAREQFEVPGLAIAVVHEGGVLLARGYGERELGAGEIVDEHTSFAIASNTKAFVATAVGLLVADGKLDWDDRVVEHMPELKLWDEHLTKELRVRDLLSHRVGLATWAGDLMWISSSFETDQILERLRHLPAASGLRERYGYCNLMFMVAGELIERVSGQSWEAFVRARLLEPLDMGSVATNLSELEGQTNLALAHIEVEGQWQTTPRLDLVAVGAAAALDASVADMSHWLLMQLAEGSYGGKQVVPEAVIRETRTPHIWRPTPREDSYQPPRTLRGYGLGWSLESYRGSLLVAHGGGLPGMVSRVLLVPDHELGVVVLTNSESSAASLLALQVADLFLVDPGDEPAKDYMGAYLETQAKAKEEAKAEGDTKQAKREGSGVPLPKGLEGSYKNPMLGAARIEGVEGALWFHAHEHGGLRCRLAEELSVAPAGDAREVQAACTWEDPNMGVSEFSLEIDARKKRARVGALRFRVRPEFYDPLEYTFERRRR